MSKLRKKPKFLFITEYYPSSNSLNIQGGVEHRTFYLTKYLARNYNVTVICSREKDKPINQNINNVRVLRVGPYRSYIQKGGVFKRVPFIISAIKSGFSYDTALLEGTGFLGILVVFLLKMIKGVKCIAFVPDVFTEFSSNYGLIGQYLLKVAEKIVFNNNWNGYITISNEVKSKLIKFGIQPDLIKVIPCGIDLNLIRKIKSEKSTFPSVCVISRLIEYKRIDDVILAIKILLKRYKDIQLNIIGKGEQENDLKKLVRNLKLKNNIKFRGSIKDYQKVLKILKSSWVYCSASIVEGFGISNIEAIALNIPYVISNILINREVTRGIGGLYFKPRESKVLAEKIDSLLKNKVLREEIVQNNYRFIETYNVEKINQRTEKYYLSLINNR